LLCLLLLMPPLLHLSLLRRVLAAPLPLHRLRGTLTAGVVAVSLRVQRARPLLPPLLSRRHPLAAAAVVAAVDDADAPVVVAAAGEVAGVEGHVPHARQVR
jgi:hypothetical protein